MSAHWWTLLVCVAGCNHVFGLEPTETTETLADVDNDGVPDTSDNCPTLPNNQVNSDGDAFGDACDACPAFASATTHDEDGDALGDECDVCPEIEDLHADQDGDGIGDECDPNPADMASADHRIAFEPFVTMPAGWQTGATGWSLADDTIAPNADLDTSDPGLTTTITTGTGKWLSASIFNASIRWQPSDRFGLIARGPAQTFSCVVTCMANGACYGVQTVDANVVYTSFLLPRPSLVVAISVKSAGLVTCFFEGDNSGIMHVSSITTSGMVLSVIASPHVRAALFEHVQ